MWAHDQPWFLSVIQKLEIVDLDHSSRKRTHGSCLIFWLRHAQREARWIFWRLRGSHASLTEQSERGGPVDPGVLRLRRASLGAFVAGGRFARAARAVDSAAWRGEIGPVAVLQLLGRPERTMRGSCSPNNRAWMAVAAIGTIWRGVAAQPPCIRGRGAHTSAAWGRWWRGIPASINSGRMRWGGCPQWSAGHAFQRTVRAAR